MSYNLAEAGKAIGMSKSSVLRAIRRGAISASRDELTGGWAIDPAELHRVFAPVASGAGQPLNGTPRNGHENVEIRELRARLADAQDQVTDLRRRLDDEAAERRRLTLLLTDQRPAELDVEPSTGARTRFSSADQRREGAHPPLPGWRRLLRVLGHGRR